MTARVPVTQRSGRGRTTRPGSQKPRATLGNGRGERPDGAGLCRRAFLWPFAALPGECSGRRMAGSAAGPAVFMLLCRRLFLSRDPLPGAGARGGRAASGGGAVTIAAREAGQSRGRGIAGLLSAPAVLP